MEVTPWRAAYPTATADRTPRTNPGGGGWQEILVSGPGERWGRDRGGEARAPDIWPPTETAVAAITRRDIQ